MAEIPNDISIELTYRCNYRCKWCYCGKSKASELSVDEWLKILQRCYDGGARKLMLTGGEPLLFAGRYDIMKGALDIGYSSVSLFSNGSLIRESDLLELKSLGAYWAVSLSGRSQYEVLTGAKVSYSDILVKIEQSVGLGVPVGVSSVLTASNLDEMEMLVADCRKVGVYHVQLGFVMASGRAMEHPELLLDVDACKEIVQRYKALRTLYPKKYVSLSRELQCTCKSRLERSISWLEGCRCVAGEKYAVITPDGRMKPCFHLTNQDYWGRYPKQSLLGSNAGADQESMR